MITKKCKQCGGGFEIPDDDLNFYKKISMPAPDFCFACRHQRRLSFRNEMNLYHRKCDFSGKAIISMYSPDKPYKIYDQQIWWSDKWDPLEYSRDFDFNKSFVEQYLDLQRVVPRMSLNNINAENSEYSNYAFSNKNSYLVFTADFNETCSYLRFSDRNYRCFDCDYTYDSIDCYECLDAEKCNGCLWSQKINNSSGLIFCYNMIGCHDCICCANLRNKQNCIFNEQYSREEFIQRKAAMHNGNYSDTLKMKGDYKDFLEKQPRKYREVINCENCLGDNLKNSKNATHCYNCMNLEDCKYMINCYYAKDCYDWDFVGLQGSERCHEMVSSALNMVDCHFCANSWDGNNEIYYCELCLHNSNLFGCIGLQHKKYCILNKQYSKEEYEKLLPKIIAHMTKTGEWGNFFPMEVSPFAYNETVANEYFPLKKEKIIEKGWRFFDDESEKLYRGPDNDIPENIADIDDDFCKKILICEKTQKPFKIIPVELEFYKKMKIPAPHISPMERHKIRMSLRNSWILWNRECSKCGKEIKSTYNKDRVEPIYCEECYIKYLG